MRPLCGRCRTCDSRFALREVAEARNGLCPRCAEPLSDQWTVLLVEECDAVEGLAEALIRSLRRLAGLPGNLELQHDELFTNLETEVPWHESIESEPDLVTREIDRLLQLLDGYTPPEELTNDVRMLANRLVGLATVLDANQEATDPAQTGAGAAARAAAEHLGDIADAIERGEPDSALRLGLQRAAGATDG